MKKELIYSCESLYREPLNVYGYHFGKGEKAACIVGSFRGNEIQQMYICSQLIRTLKELESRGAIVSGQEILVIPAVNTYSMNIEKRFWGGDDRDINRSFPGDPQGDSCGQITDGIFQKICGYNYGIQFTSFYMAGDFVPHVRMMETGFQNPSLANLFGLPYVVIRDPRKVEQATLNYNWQMHGTCAFSIYASTNDRIDVPAARESVAAVLRFLTRMGIIRYTSHSGYIAHVIYDKELMIVRNNTAGLYRMLKKPGDEVACGDILAEVIDPLEGEVINQVLSPTDGIIFFAHSKSMVNEYEALFKIIRRLHA